PDLLPDAGQVGAELVGPRLGLLLGRTVRRRRRARQGVALEAVEVAGVLLQVLAALAVEGLVLLLVGLLGVALLGADVLEEFFAVAAREFCDLHAQIQTVADEAGEDPPGRVEGLAGVGL